MAIYINTNQNVQINYEISSIGDRIIAYIIDTLVIVGISIGFFLLSISIDLDITIFIVSVIVFFYHLICELTMNGQSVGKRIRGIRVMKRDGSAAGFSAYFLRFLLRPIDSFYVLGLAVVFFTDNNQRLGDLAAGTVVVNVKSEKQLKEQIEREMTIQGDLEVLYSGVTHLSDREIQIIKTVLSNRIRTKEHRNILELAKKIADKIDATYEMPKSYSFLQRVVQDYHVMHST